MPSTASGTRSLPCSTPRALRSAEAPSPGRPTPVSATTPSHSPPAGRVPARLSSPPSRAPASASVERSGRTASSMSRSAPSIAPPATLPVACSSVPRPSASTSSVSPAGSANPVRAALHVWSPGSNRPDSPGPVTSTGAPSASEVRPTSPMSCPPSARPPRLAVSHGASPPSAIVAVPPTALDRAVSGPLAVTPERSPATVPCQPSRRPAPVKLTSPPSSETSRKASPARRLPLAMTSLAVMLTLRALATWP